PRETAGVAAAVLATMDVAPFKPCVERSGALESVYFEGHDEGEAIVDLIRSDLA
ncbi:hypothetical protein MRX96_050863, partial [Rhipicephalus microplus]